MKFHIHIKVVCDGEIVCDGCGEVFGKVAAQETRPLDSDTFYPGLEKIMLPLTVQNSVLSRMGRWRDNHDKKIINAYRVFDRLEKTVEDLQLPKTYAYETMRRLLSKNKGMYSYRWQIRELIQVLEDTEDSRLYNRITELRELINEIQGI